MIVDSNSATILRFKAQANKFSGILGKRLEKPAQRVIKEMIYNKHFDFIIININYSL